MGTNTSFWKELKERRVIRVGGVYLAVAWALIQGAKTLSDILELPDFTARLVLALAVLGFPIAILLAWAFQVTPEGVRRTEPFGMTGRLNLPFIGGLTVGVLAVSGLAFVFSGSGRENSTDPGEVESGVVAVMPFRVSATDDLSYLGAGLMDLLSARLDGEFGARAVDPGAVATATSRDATGPRSVARGLGAGLVLTGSVVGGANSIVASAEYTNVLDGALRASASATGHPDSLAVIADQLIIQLLSLSAGEYSTSIASLTSTSPAALKAYLRGKQAFRDGQYLESISRLDEALTLDSTFALAAIARADGAANAIEVGVGDNLELAWRHRERLGPRDLMYLEARRPSTPRTEMENIAVLEHLTRAQPDRVEAWYWLGEAVFHTRGIVFDELWAGRVRRVFEKVLELDPSYYPALDHLILLETMWGTPEGIRGTAERIYERPDGGRTLPVYHGLARGEPYLTLDVDSLPAADPNWISLLPWAPVYHPDQAPADFIPWLDAAFEEVRQRIGIDISFERALRAEYHINLAIGRPARAESVREESIRLGLRARHDRIAIYDALWAGVALDDAAEAVRQIDARLRTVRGASLSLLDARSLAAAEIWRYRQDPAYAESTAVASLRAAAAGVPHPQSLELEAFALIIEAWAQVRKEDPRAKASLARLVGILDEGPRGDVVIPRALFAAAAIHEELGDVPGALEVLDRTGLGITSPEEYIGPIFRQRGRLAALAGDVPRAIHEYRRWLNLQVGAEASMLPEVEAVRAELAQLQGESAGDVES
ncbi:MAG: hypothetical protein WD960_06935 [Gemmatimonadota bacterium]